MTVCIVCVCVCVNVSDISGASLPPSSPVSELLVPSVSGECELHTVTQTHTHAYTYTHAHIHTCIHTHMRTYTHYSRHTPEIMYAVLEQVLYFSDYYVCIGSALLLEVSSLLHNDMQ